MRSLLANLRFFRRFCDRPLRLLLVALAGALVQTLATAALPWLMQLAFQQVSAVPTWRTVLLFAGVMLAVLLVKMAAAVITRLRTVAILKQAVGKLRLALLRHTYASSRRQFHARNLGSLHNTLVQDSERVDWMISALVSEVLPAGIIVVLLSGVLVALDWRLFLVLAMVTVPGLVALRLLVSREMHRRIAAYHERFEQFSHAVFRALSLWDLTKIQAADDLEIERKATRIGELNDCAQQVVVSCTWQQSLQQLLGAATAAGMLLLAGLLAAQGYLTPGTVAAFYVSAWMLRRHLDLIASRQQFLAEGLSAMRRIREVLETPAEAIYQGSRKLSASHSLELCKVSFSYDRPLLENIHLRLQRGSVTAITGVSGAGKSTLLYLLLGLYRPQQGELLADGVPYDQLDLDELRRGIGVILQDPLLFGASVRENLAYGCLDAGEEDVRLAARLAVAERFIDELPQGFETAIGEEGVRLSGGQRQRLAIARALLARPKFIFFDEPTNHLDPGTVARLLENFRQLPEQPGVAVITHDPHVVAIADQVFSLQRGRLMAA